MSSNHSIFTKSKNRLSLVTDVGQKYSGLNNSKSPELCQRVTAFFECLNTHIGFPQTDLGRDNQTVFNLLLKSVYPEIMIDLADLIYVQHERPAVYLNFDHIHMNFKKDKVALPDSVDQTNEKFSILFRELARTIRETPLLFSDAQITRLLSESYSIYLFQTKNFPWDNPMEMIPADLKGSVMDCLLYTSPSPRDS